MRVIAGSARGLRLRAPRGLAVRPTSDRLREALFSVLGQRVVGARWLDVCAGTGAIGIEALSRGAAGVVFCERDRAALAALESNLAACRAGDRAEVMRMPWSRALAVLGARPASFDLIYYDPPWAEAQTGAFLTAALTLLAPAGLLLVEHPRRQVLAAPAGLSVRRRLEAGEAAVTFLEQPESGKEPVAG